jgi:protein-glutamine gamma-glutamyltransferase
MEPRRQRLNPDELHLLRWFLGGALSLLSIVTVFYLDIGSELMAAVVAAGVGAALVRPTWPGRVPRWVHRFAFPAIVLFFVVDLWTTGELLPATVRLDLLLLLYRGIGYRARRDDLQIVILGLFLIVVAGVLTVSLLFAAQILVFTACALSFLMVVTIAASAEGGRAPKLAVRGVVPPWAAHADWGRLFRNLRACMDWRLLASALLLFAGVVAVSGLLFVVIPRFQLENSLFLERFITKKAKTGFSDSIRFGDITEILEDDGVALDVDISDPTQAPATPYWRMVVLDEYRDGGFRLSAGMKSQVLWADRTDANLRPLNGPRGAPTWTFYLEAGVSRYLPLLGRFDSVRFREAQNYRYSGELGILTLRDEPATMTAYRVEGMAPDMTELRDPPFAARLKNRVVKGRLPLQLSLGLSPDDAAALARIASGIGLPVGLDPGSFAQRVSDWLRRQHGYTLAPRIPGGRGDPLVRWIASGEAGHCELFAGALVMIARSAGIPARVITGFKGGTWNGFSGNYTIRNSDAHAWAEIWDAQKGAWLREDPLATISGADASEEKGDAALAGRTDRSWAARFNSLRVFWYRRIVNFDQQSQVDTLRAFKNATDHSGKWLRLSIGAVGSRIKSWFLGRWDAPRYALTAAAAAALAGGFWVIATGRWRLAAMSRGRRVDPVRREAGRWLVRVKGPPPLVADLQRLRYGPAPTWPRPSEVFRRARRAASSSRRRRPVSSQSTF